MRVCCQSGVLYLLGVLPGPVDVVAPGNDDGKLPIDQQSVFNVQRREQRLSEICELLILSNGSF